MAVHPPAPARRLVALRADGHRLRLGIDHIIQHRDFLAARGSGAGAERDRAAIDAHARHHHLVEDEAEERKTLVRGGNGKLAQQLSGPVESLDRGLSGRCIDEDGAKTADQCRPRGAWDDEGEIDHGAADR